MTLVVQATFYFYFSVKASIHFINGYLYWIHFLFIITGIILFYINPLNVLEHVWFGEKLDLLIVAYIASFSFHQFWPIAYKIAEASRKTLILHIILNVTNVVHLIILIFLFVLEIQSLEFIFTIISIEWFIASMIASRLYKNSETTNLSPLS